MIMILFRACSATLGHTFEYLYCYHQTYQKFFRDVQSQKVHEKMAFGPHFWNLGGPQNFEKVMCVSHYSYNSFYIFRYVCRIIVIIFRACSATLEYTFECLTCYHWTYENFFRAVSSQKVHERIAYASHFWILERTPKF